MWGTYTSSFDFNSSAYTPSEAVAAIIVGLGGAGAITRYLHVEEKIEEHVKDVKDLKAVSDDSLEAYQKVSTLIDQASPKEHNEAGGQDG